MSWPASPYNGQQITVNGILYSYNSGNKTWDRIGYVAAGISTDTTVIANLSVTNNTNLGDVSTVHITGGSPGFILKTNGSGELTWNPEAGLTAGGENTYVQFNDNAKLGGISNFAFNKDSNTLTVDYASLRLTTSANNQPNITDVGTLNKLAVLGNVTAGNTTLSGILQIGTTVISSSGITASSYTSPGSSNQVLLNKAGNIDGSSNLTFTNSNLLTVTGNITANNITANTFTGNLTTSSQPNITTIGTLGNLVVTSNITSTNIKVAFANANIYNAPNSTANTQILVNKAGNIGSYSNLYFDGNLLTVTGNILARNANLGNSATANYLLGNVYTSAQPYITSLGTLDSLIVTGNASAENVNAGNLLTANYITGNLTSGPQTGITTVGNLTTLRVLGNANVDGNLYIGGVTVSAGGITAPTFTGNVNGNISGTLTAPGSDKQILFNKAGNVSASANITFTEGGGPSRPANLTVVGNIRGNSISAVNTISAPNISGTLTAGSGYQPNIISLGTLNSLTVDGGDGIFRNSVIDTTTNVSIRGPLIPTGFEEYDIGSPEHHWRDLYLAGHTIRLGNTIITATAANGLVVSGPVTATGGVSSDTSTSSFSLPTLTATSTGGVSTLTFTPQTIVPFVKGSFITITNVVPTGYNGTYTVSDATTSSVSYLKTVVGSQTTPGVIAAGASPPFTVTSTLEVANLNVQFLQGFEPAITDISNTIVLRDENSSFQANIITANRFAGSADTANTVLASSQPNIRSVGTLTSLSVTGNINASNVVVDNYVDATWVRANVRDSSGYLGSNIIGQVSYAAVANNVSGSNVDGQVSNALIAGTVYSHEQPNITKVGILDNLHVAGNADIDGNLHVGGTVISAGGITAPSFNGALSGTISSPGANTEIVFNKQGILGTDSDFTYNNLTKSLTTIGKLYSSDADLGNAVIANYFVGNAYYLTHIQGANIDGTVPTATKAGTVTSSAQPNIHSVGDLTSLHVLGDATIDGNIYIGGVTVSEGGLSTPTIVIDKGSITTDQPVSINEEWNNSLVSFTSFQQEIIDTASDPTSLLAEFNVNGLNVFKIDKAGNVTAKDITARNIAGTLTAARQTNITALGKLGSLNVSGEVAFDGNLTVGANVTTSAYFKGDGSLLTGLPRPTEIKNNDNSSNVKINTDGNVTVSVANDSNVVIISDANVTIKDTIISANANLGNLVKANFFQGNGYYLINVNGANVTGTVPLATSATTAGTVTASSQPSITSLGTLVSLNTTSTVDVNLGNSVTSKVFLGRIGVGNAVQPNITSVGTLTALTTSSTVDASLGNSVTTNYIKSDGTYLFNIPGANVTGTVASATAATTAGTVTTAAQPNITSVGSLTSLDVSGTTTTKDITVTGNLTITGDTITANATSLVVKDPLIELGGNLNGLLTTDDGYDRGIVMHYYTGGSQTDAFVGWKNLPNPSDKEFVFASKATIATNIATIVNYGNIKAGNANIIGNLKVGGNLIGTLDATSNAQPNITSIGKLSTLVVGNTTNFATHGSGTITTNGNITVTTGYYFVGDGSKLSGIDSSSIKNGTSNVSIPTTDSEVNVFVGGARVANFTSSGINSANLNLSANLTAGNAFVTSKVRAPTLEANVADGTAPLTITSKTRVVNLNVDYANVSDYNVVKNTTTGTYYPALINGVTDGNYQFAGNSGLSYNVATSTLSAANLSGTLTTAAQPNITSIGRLSALTVGGSVQNTVFGSGTITANGLIQSTDLTVERTPTDLASGLGKVNFTKTANVTLGDIANLHVLGGGTDGDFLQSTGTVDGGLRWAKPKGKITTTVNNFLAGSGFDIVTDYTDPLFPSGKFIINQVGPVALSITDSWASGGSSKNAYTDFTVPTINTQNISITITLTNATFAITATDTIVIGGVAITGTNITGLGISGTGGTYTITSTLLNSITGGSAIQTAASNAVSINLTTSRGSYTATGTTLTNVQPTPFSVSLSGGFTSSSVPYWATTQAFNWNMAPVIGTVASGNVIYAPTAGGASTSLTSTGATSGSSASINSLVSYTITTTDYRGTGLNGGGTKTLPTINATVAAATSYAPLFYKITTTSTTPTLTISDLYLPYAYILGQGATTPSVTTSYIWIATPGTAAHTWAITTSLGQGQIPPAVGPTVITISGQSYNLYGFTNFNQATLLYTVT